MDTDDSSQVKVLGVAGRAMLDQFIRVPWSIYSDDPNWVPPLMIERRESLSPKNPFFKHAEWACWIALRDGAPVGRISAQVDRLHLERHDEATGFFGLIEAIDDPHVFSALFSIAEAWLKEQGMKRALGPFNLGINQEIGLLVDGFDSPPFIMMGHARPYYAEAIERLGYAPAQDLLAYELNPENFGMPPVMRKLLDRQAGRVSARPFNRRQKQADIEVMRDIFNDAWSENWGFVPFTKEEFQAVGKELLMIVPDELIRIAEVEGEPAAFIALIPNINEAIRDLDGRLLPFGWARLLWRVKVRGLKSGRIALMGVRKKYQHTRLGPALAFLSIEGLEEPALRRGIKRVEMSWVLDSNKGTRNIIEQVTGKITKRYRMYEKELA